MTGASCVSSVAVFHVEEQADVLRWFYVERGSHAAWLDAPSWDGSDLTAEGDLETGPGLYEMGMDETGQWVRVFRPFMGRLERAAVAQGAE
jgi:hypothetical protein